MSLTRDHKDFTSARSSFCPAKLILRTRSLISSILGYSSFVCHTGLQKYNLDKNESAQMTLRIWYPVVCYNDAYIYQAVPT